MAIPFAGHFRFIEHLYSHSQVLWQSLCMCGKLSGVTGYLTRKWGPDFDFEGYFLSMKIKNGRRIISIE